MNDYKEFLKAKQGRPVVSGFHPGELPDTLFEFQKYCVTKSLTAGKYALFADCGLGKTRMQILFAQRCNEHTGKPSLILCPLSVSGQTIQEGQAIGVDILRAQFWPEHPIQIANYEQLEKIDTSKYGCVVLDESSILKNFEGAYRNLIIDRFKLTPYKLCCTATPSPNDPMELGNHSEFLDIMSRNEMLSMYFVHDGGETAKWRLKGHCRKIFWEWVSSWAVVFSDPKDMGFEMEGYKLPDLNFIEKQITTDKRNNGLLFNDVAVSATNFNKELRITKLARLDQVSAIVNKSKESFIIWVKQNEEADSLLEMIPGAIEVRGSDKNEKKEQALLDFANNKFRVLITKAKIAGYGMNFQNCHNQVFASPDFSFETLYQGIRRSWRFRQEHDVNIYLITTDTMKNVIEAINRKQKQFEEMKKEMTIFSAHKNRLKMVREFKEYKTDQVVLQLGDCVELIRKVPDESIGLSVFSPPFAELYTYSDELEDMGNSKDYKEFFTAFNYLVKDLYRVLWSGRNVVVHCMDLPIQKGKEGFIGLRDFSGMILNCFADAGFIYHSRVTIWKNPVTEMQRTKALGLLHKQIKKDAAMSRVGIPDYLLVFRKPGEHMHPVIHNDTDAGSANYLPVDVWQKYASPVWMDIDYGNTLNKSGAREEKDEKHIAPLQLETIERAIHLWSNEGDTILTPFAGIGSELWQAMKMNRKGIGFELKGSYYEIARQNLIGCAEGMKQLKLF
jgi:hypothetical protein